jgi:dolichol kinase
MRAVCWELSRPLLLLAGALLVAVASLVGTRLAQSAWRRQIDPKKSTTGTLSALLFALFGALLVFHSVVFFPGPIPVLID